MTSLGGSTYPHIPMDREERIRRFGIECIGPAGDGIFFKAGTWRPGGEYIQKLIIRNVSTSVKKLKYKLPSTRYFSLAYPEPIVLSPGLFKEVDVVFRPVEYEPYDDTLYIKMLDGIDGNGFHIAVRATIDNLSLSAPTGLDLGYCATHQITQQTFELVNTGEVDAPYEWEVPEPFSFVPSKGIVPVGMSHTITLSIRPTDASVFVAQAICKVGLGVHAIIPEPIIVTKLSAIGKFAYITLSDAMISFDEVVSGMKPDKKEIVLYNNSVVPAEFELVRLDADRDEVFEIYPKEGIIPPRSEIPVVIHFRANAMGTYSHDRYTFRTPGNCNTVLTLKGLAMPPKVYLFKDVKPVVEYDTVATLPNGIATGYYQQTSHPNPNSVDTHSTLKLVTTMEQTGVYEEGAPLFSLNFRDTEVGKTETRLFFLANESPKEVVFAIIGDDHGMFQMSPKQGRIPSFTHQYPVKISFSPGKPINYYRRFFVLIGDALPLFYDCIGTGFIRAKGEIKEQRPALMRPAHIQAYRNRSVDGCGYLSPDELDKLYNNVSIPREYFALVGRKGTKALSVTNLPRPVTRTGESVRNLVAPANEFFIEQTDSTATEIVINRINLEFGYTPHKSTSLPQEVVITNQTHGKVVVQWYIPAVHGMDQKAIDALEAQYLTNTRDMITADQDEKQATIRQAFSVYPMIADINPGQSMTFSVTFVPKQSNRNFYSQLEAFVFFKNQRTFRLVNDYSLTPPWCLTVNCLGHTFGSGQLLAKAHFIGGNIHQNKLLFPCCFVGESIYQVVMLQNTSNLPCTFHLDVGWSAHDERLDSPPSRTRRLMTTTGDGKTAIPQSDIFAIKPTIGEIDAESFVLICVQFTPQACKRYSNVIRVAINGDENSSKLLLEGTGNVPHVVVPEILEPQLIERRETNIDHPTRSSIISNIWGLPVNIPKEIPSGFLGELYLQPTCIGLTSKRVITLKNASRLPCKFHMLLPNNAQQILTITPMTGVLKGNDAIELEVVFAPKKSIDYSFKVSYEIYPIGGKVSKRVLDSFQPGPVEAPELLQKCSFVLHGQGEMGALLFTPPFLNIDVRLVHTQEEQSIWLENVSDVEVAYTLYYQETFEPDRVNIETNWGKEDDEEENANSPTGEEKQGGLVLEDDHSTGSKQPLIQDGKVVIPKEISQIMPLQPLASFQPGPVDKALNPSQSSLSMSQARFSKSVTFASTLNGTNAGGGEGTYTIPANPNEFEHSLFCEQPHGRIAARSKTRLVFTYKPNKSGLFEFLIMAQLHSLDSNTKEPLLLTNDEAAVLRMTQSKEISLSRVDQVFPAEGSVSSPNGYSPSKSGNGGKWYHPESAEYQQLVQELTDLPLTTSIVTRAAFPKLLFEDIRLSLASCPTLETPVPNHNQLYLWQNFSFSSLNYDLSVPMTLEEIKINTSSSPNLSLLKRYPFQFSPNVLGSVTQTFYVRLRNHGYLETSFSLHLPNEKTLNLEAWCDEEEPSEELNRIICIIEELKLFTIEPRHGKLSPGESCILTVSYKYNSLKYQGKHNLPVLMKLSQGKQYYLNLIGQTLLPNNSNNGANALYSQQNSIMVPPSGGGKSVSVPPSRNPSSMYEGDRGTISRKGSTLGANTAAGGSANANPTNAAEILLILGPANPQNIIPLAPVPTGLSPAAMCGYPMTAGTALDSAPLQYIELINVSANLVHYEVFLGLSEAQWLEQFERQPPTANGNGAFGGRPPLQHTASAQNLIEAAFNPTDVTKSAILDANHALNVCYIANPTGFINANSSIQLEIFFYPIQKKLYNIPIHVKYCYGHHMITGTSHQQSFDLQESTFAAVPSTRSTILKRGNTSNKSRGMSSKSNAWDSGNYPGDVPSFIKYEFTKATISALGYDPRVARPIPLEHLYEGGRPLKTPILNVSDQMIRLYEDDINFGIIPRYRQVRRIFTLYNASPVNAYEFTFDETSCSLCVDSLLSISPVFGKIDPLQYVVIECVFTANCQAMIFQQLSMKLLIRELLKLNNKSRGGTRQQLLDRIAKAKKMETVEHESVVSRATFSRSMQVLLTEKGQVKAPFTGEVDEYGDVHAALGSHSAHDDPDANNPFVPKKKTPKFPNTVTSKGKIATANIQDAIKTLRPPQMDSEDAALIEEYLAYEQQTLRSRSTSPTHKQNGGARGSVSFVNIQESIPGGGANDAGSVASGGGSLPGTANRMSSGRSRDGTAMGSTVMGSRQNTAMTPTSGGRRGTSSDSYYSNANGARYGQSYVLKVRFQGEVYSEETIRTLFNRYPTNIVAVNLSRTIPGGVATVAAMHKIPSLANHNHQIVNMNEFLHTYHTKTPFIPLIESGKKYYDPEFRKEQEKLANKAKINIRFVTGRDDEFRDVAAQLMNSLLKNVLSGHAVKDTLYQTITQSNSFSIPLIAHPPLNPLKRIEQQSSQTNNHGYQNSHTVLPKHSESEEHKDGLNNRLPVAAYPVYFPEVQEQCSDVITLGTGKGGSNAMQGLLLHQKFILEAKALGYTHTTSTEEVLTLTLPPNIPAPPSSSSSSSSVVPVVPPKPSSQGITTMGVIGSGTVMEAFQPLSQEHSFTALHRTPAEINLLADMDYFALNLLQLATLLEELGIAGDMKTFGEIVNSVNARMPGANTPGGRASFEASGLTKTLITIKEWVYGLTLPTQRKLERKLNSLKDARMRRRGVPEIAGNTPSSPSRPSSSGRNSPKRPQSSKRNSIASAVTDETASKPQNPNIFTNDVLLRNDVHETVGYSLNQLFLQILHETITTANLVTRHGLQGKEPLRKVEIVEEEDVDIY